MFIVDANVLLYAANKTALHHRSGRIWLDGALSGDEPVGFAWIALLAFLRLSTRPGVFPKPLAPKQAFGVVEEWMAQPVALEVHPTVRHFAVLRGLVEEVGAAGNLTTDAHLAALAIEHGAELVSFDRDFQRFQGLQSQLLT